MEAGEREGEEDEWAQCELFSPIAISETTTAVYSCVVFSRGALC